jgi:2-phospho-L-lactate guanylyltransferase (CobY/MobA/RfbA family)
LRLTNAADAFQFAFGDGSFGRHLVEADRLGLTVGTHEAFGIGFDLDTPDDWEDFLALFPSVDAVPEHAFTGPGASWRGGATAR